MRRPDSARSACGPTEHSVTESPVRSGDPGYSLLELIFVLGLAVTIGATTLPQLSSTIDDARASGAARFVAARLQELRMEAIVRSTDVGFQFVRTEKGYAYAAFVDGNGNGIRTTDIERGIESALFPSERLSDRFPGVDFGVIPGIPGVDDGAPPGLDPIKLGTSNILTFTSTGTSSSGSLYVRGKGDLQFVLRVFGDTAKTRVLRYDPRNRQWRGL